MCWHTVNEHGIGQRVDHIWPFEAVFDADRQTAAAVLVDQAHEPQASAVVRGVMHKVIRPDVVRVSRSQADT